MRLQNDNIGSKTDAPGVDEMRARKPVTASLHLAKKGSVLIYPRFSRFCEKLGSNGRWQARKMLPEVDSNHH